MSASSHFTPVLASYYGGGDLGVVLIAWALTALGMLAGLLCLIWKRHLMVRLLMRLMGVACLLLTLLILAVIPWRTDWIFLTFPGGVGVLLFVLAHPWSRKPPQSE